LSEKTNSHKRGIQITSLYFTTFVNDVLTAEIIAIPTQRESPASGIDESIYQPNSQLPRKV